MPHLPVARREVIIRALFLPEGQFRRFRPVPFRPGPFARQRLLEQRDRRRVLLRLERPLAFLDVILRVGLLHPRLADQLPAVRTKASSSFLFFFSLLLLSSLKKSRPRRRRRRRKRGGRHRYAARNGGGGGGGQSELFCCAEKMPSNFHSNYYLFNPLELIETKMRSIHMSLLFSAALNKKKKKKKVSLLVKGTKTTTTTTTFFVVVVVVWDSMI